MLFVNPRQVTFGSTTWGNVESVKFERSSAKLFVEYSDTGPHAVAGDVPEQKVEITVKQELLSDDLDAPTPGEVEELAFTTGPNSSDAGTKDVTVANAMVVSCDYEVSLRRGSSRTIKLVALSGNGTQDPVSVTAAS